MYLLEWSPLIAQKRATALSLSRTSDTLLLEEIEESAEQSGEENGATDD